MEPPSGLFLDLKARLSHQILKAAENFLDCPGSVTAERPGESQAGTVIS